MGRKAEAKRRKAERLRNKKMVARYPWIQAVDWNGNRTKTYDYTMYDEVPIGWKRACLYSLWKGKCGDSHGGVGRTTM